MDDTLKKLAEKYALYNAVKYRSPPRTESVLGKILSEHPELRKDVKHVKEVVEEVVKTLSNQTYEGWKKRLEEIAPEMLEYRKEKKPKKGLKELPNAVKGKVVMRFAPNPNGPPTLGSARGIILNSEYAKMYEGKFILRFDDTDPVNKRPIPEAYEWYIKDCIWLGAEPDEVVYASDRLELYYEIAEELIRKGHAYMCFCSSEEFRTLKASKKACPHRDTSPKENMEWWRSALDGELSAGSAVLRIKTDITHPDPALRDFGAFRIVDVPHPRVGDKYRVWPLLDFESAVEDHMLGITHILRGKELSDSEKRQKFIYSYLGWEYPVVVHWGRIKIHEFGRLSTSSLAKAIEEGVYGGWDDPRVPSVMAFRRRGIQAEAIRRFYLSLGVDESDISVSLENLYAENRKLIDPRARRFFMVKNPLLVEVRGAESTVANPLVHPKRTERRKIEVRAVEGVARVYVEKDEFEQLPDGRTIRLKNLYIVRKEGDCFYHVKSEFVRGELKKKKIKVIHWAPEDGLGCLLRAPEGDYRGVCEREVANHVDEVVQFERVGFARIDCVAEEEVVAYFAHK
jgi:glutamyl-tRNA synthetase